MNRPLLTLVYAYYENADMLRRQIVEWLGYPDKILQNLEVIITDDCSSDKPIMSVLDGNISPALNMRVFRITKKVEWNWLACRNIGAHYAAAEWILMTDMDHLIQLEHMRQIMRMIKSCSLHSKQVYLFTRVDAPSNEPYKPHNDSFLLTKSMFWKSGGYDEELSGNYGTSGSFRRRLFKTASSNVRLSIPLTRYTREVIADASTVGFSRKEGRDPGVIKKLIADKVKAGRGDRIWTLTFPYEEIK